MTGKVLVLGAGVVGLSAAVRLREAGFDARIQARDAVGDTVSSVAAAIVFPWHAAPPERVTPWARRSLEVFAELAEEPGSGVLVRDALTAGMVFSAYVAEMPVYLPWLARRFEALGGTIERRTVASLDEALAACPLVVNCAGLGARELCDDPRVFAIRGQVLRVPRSGVERCTITSDDEDELGYVIARSDDCVIGGTAQERDERTEPDAGDTERILAVCARLEPRLAGARVESIGVGLRPGRDVVRLEVEQRAGGHVVHDYGHGGCGVTLSWGCAEEVVELVRGLSG